VCSTRDVVRVEALGANTVIDRKQSDPLASESACDMVFDTPAVYSFGRCAKVLRAGGTYVTTLPDAALFSSKRCRFVQVASRRADLELVGAWLSDGLEVPRGGRREGRVDAQVAPFYAVTNLVGYGAGIAAICVSIPL
jgi:NADPH:quinone reductase-like Zn-dependent oxidoreductase